jgi:hypothetical protein
LPRQLS